MAEPVEWHVLHPRDSRVSWLVATCAGLVFGGVAAVLVAPAVAGGTLPSVPTAFAALLASVVASVTIDRYRNVRERTPLADALAVDVAGVRWLPIAGVVAAAGALAVPWLGEGSIAQLALLGAVLGAIGILVVQTLRGAGRFDPETGTATVEGRVYDLERSPTTAIPLAGLTVVVVGRPAPSLLERYGVLAMPTTAYREAARETAGTGL